MIAKIAAILLSTIAISFGAAPVAYAGSHCTTNCYSDGGEGNFHCYTDCY
jgi:hypothetical protein